MNTTKILIASLLFLGCLTANAKKSGLSDLQCKDKDISPQLMAAYFAGCIIYCLENKQKDHNFDMHYFALSKMMTYYEKNRSITGSDKEMDK
ncbi:MAG: hypothetical protein UE068_09850 [Paludibacteraceae bacterium]|nr:hypothetical protein [Paludibacteraceae bacterium]